MEKMNIDNEKVNKLLEILGPFVKERKQLGQREKERRMERIDELAEELGITETNYREMLKIVQRMSSGKGRKYTKNYYKENPEAYKAKNKRYTENRTKYALMLGKDEADILALLEEAGKVNSGKKKYVVNAIRFYEKHKNDFNENDDK